MRIEIASHDRIGISQEILASFAKNGWNITAMEVALQVTYVHINTHGVTLDQVRAAVEKIDGVIGCQSVKMLPTESRENHLQTLLARIPDPIFDVDSNGRVLTMNQAAKALVIEKHQTYTITELLNISDAHLASKSAVAVEVTYMGQQFVAEITPVIVEEATNGAVVILKAVQAIGRQISLMQQPTQHHLTSIISRSSNMALLKQQLLKFAEIKLPVLISGETGTGKELFARAIHQSSSRKNAPFLAINCAALPEHLLESELFGYAPGAFTGAQKSGKPGLFELAKGGTVFLDEIAEMSTYLQAKLLRFLEDFTYRRVGGTVELKADVRIISASHQHFPELIHNKRFREDLFYRLNVLSLTLPALRERLDDIDLLADHFIESAAEQVNQNKPKLSSAALAQLKKHPWPGNIRQFQNILFRVIALNDKKIIEQDDILAVLGQVELSESPEHTQSFSDFNWENIPDWRAAQAVFEKQILEQLLPVYPSTRKLAERLNVSHNKIAMKLREHGL